MSLALVSMVIKVHLRAAVTSVRGATRSLLVHSDGDAMATSLVQVCRFTLQHSLKSLL